MAEFDIVGFFDHLRHGRLLREVAKEVDDPEVIGLIRRWLRAGVCTDDGLVPSQSGTPQGGVISQVSRPKVSEVFLFIASSRRAVGGGFAAASAGVPGCCQSRDPVIGSSPLAPATIELLVHATRALVMSAWPAVSRLGADR